MDYESVVAIVKRSNDIAYCASSNRFKMLLEMRKVLMVDNEKNDVGSEQYDHIFNMIVKIENLLATVKSERDFFWFKLGEKISNIDTGISMQFDEIDALIGTDFIEPLSFKEDFDGLSDKFDSFKKVDYSKYPQCGIDDIIDKYNTILSSTIMSIYRYIAIATIVILNDDGSDRYKILLEIANGSISYFNTAKQCFGKLYNDDSIFMSADYDSAKCATRLYALKESDLTPEKIDLITTISVEAK